MSPVVTSGIGGYTSLEHNGFLRKSDSFGYSRSTWDRLWRCSKADCGNFDVEQLLFYKEWNFPSY